MLMSNRFPIARKQHATGFSPASFLLHLGALGKQLAPPPPVANVRDPPTQAISRLTRGPIGVAQEEKKRMGPSNPAIRGHFEDLRFPRDPVGGPSGGRSSFWLLAKSLEPRESGVERSG